MLIYERTYVLNIVGVRKMNRQRLHNIVDQLDEWQVRFVIRYITKLFNMEEDA